jgi:hypothetical protein
VIMCGHDGRRGFIHHTCEAGGYRHKEIGTQLVEDALKPGASVRRCLSCSGSTRAAMDSRSIWDLQRALILTTETNH